MTRKESAQAGGGDRAHRATLTPRPPHQTRPSHQDRLPASAGNALGTLGKEGQQRETPLHAKACLLAGSGEGRKRHGFSSRGTGEGGPKEAELSLGGPGEMREGIPGNMRKGSEVGCGKDAGTLSREGTGSVGGVRGEQAR